MNYTPPSWLRHLTSWKVLIFLDNHLETCWVRMAMWKMFPPDKGRWFHSEETWWPDSSCFIPYDYCAKYDPELSGTERTHPLYEALKQEAVPPENQEAGT